MSDSARTRTTAGAVPWANETAGNNNPMAVESSNMRIRYFGQE